MGLGISIHASSVTGLRACAVEAHYTLGELERAMGLVPCGGRRCRVPAKRGGALGVRDLFAGQLRRVAKAYGRVSVESLGG